MTLFSFCDCRVNAPPTDPRTERSHFDPQSRHIIRTTNHLCCQTTPCLTTLSAVTPNCCHTIRQCTCLSQPQAPCYKTTRLPAGASPPVPHWQHAMSHVSSSSVTSAIMCFQSLSRPLLLSRARVRPPTTPSPSLIDTPNPHEACSCSFFNSTI